jgi:hypothetical protein
MVTDAVKTEPLARLAELEPDRHQPQDHQTGGTITDIHTVDPG